MGYMLGFFLSFIDMNGLNVENKVLKSLAAGSLDQAVSSLNKIP